MAKLGTYQLGKHKVHVSTDNSRNGEFDDNRIKIGLGGTWADVLSVAIHEIMEMCCSDNNCRLIPDVDYGGSNDSYVFLMTHPQFAEMCGQIAHCLVSLAPDLYKVYRAKNSDTVSKKSRRKRKK